MGLFEIEKKTGFTAKRDAPQIKLHEDLKGLLWFADGPLKNFTKPSNSKYRVERNGIKLEFIVGGMLDEEPSLIYIGEPIIIPSDVSDVPRPPYYPRYKELSPEQKGVYIKLLENPYNPKIDIGYVFILYYGLERHLMQGDYERSADVIHKLRAVHDNGSFHAYSANALVLVGMLRNKTEIVSGFLDSWLKDKGVPFCTADLFLLVCYLSNLPLSPKGTMKMAGTFGFDNKNYIKKCPEIFEEELRKKIVEKFGGEEIFLQQILSEQDIANLPDRETHIFANTSLQGCWIPMKTLSESQKLKDEMKALLVAAHESTKARLAETRKSTKKSKTGV